MISQFPQQPSISRFDGHRSMFLWIACCLMALIALADAFIFTETSIGPLQIVPVLIFAAFLPRSWTLLLCFISAVMREAFAPDGPLPVRMLVLFAGFAGSALFTAELARSRRLTAELYQNLRSEVQRRQRSESDLQLLVRTTPIGILTIEGNGQISRANKAAEELLGVRGGRLDGQQIGGFVPLLARMLERPDPSFHSTAECSGFREGGEAFLASVWFSREKSDVADRLVVVITDESDHVRMRRDEAMQASLNASRALVGAVSQELRGLTETAEAAFAELLVMGGSLPEQAVHSLAVALQRLRELGNAETGDWQDSPDPLPGPVNLVRVMTELRVLIEPMFRDLGSEVTWVVPAQLPLVVASHDAVLQVLLMLVRNSHKALRDSPPGWIRFCAEVRGSEVLLSLADSGSGLPEPGQLDSSNLARPELLPIFLARAVLRSLGGDLTLLAQPSGGRRFDLALPRTAAARKLARQAAI